MNQKKTMKTWQMAILLVLAAAMLAVMFLPAYHIDSEALKKGMEKAQIEEDYYENDEARDKDIEKDTKKFEKKLKKEKDTYGTDNESISVLNLMTKSFPAIRYGKDHDENYAKAQMGKKMYDTLNKKHFLTRVLLWGVYGLLLIVILIILLGYCLKINKYVPLSICTFYGLLASAAFAVLRFGTISGVKTEVEKLTKELIPKAAFNNVDTAEIASGFLAYAFWLGLIVAAAFFLISVISMFVGNQAEMEYGGALEAASMDGWDNEWNPPYTQMTVAQPPVNEQKPEDTSYFGDVQGVAPFNQGYTEPAGMVIRPQPEPQPQPQITPVQETPKKPKVRHGKVSCTKGMTSGASAYALPQERKVIVGKSPQKANMVIVNNTHISNVHCTIRYRADTGGYIVRDHSTNGTFVNGIRLNKGISQEYPAGTILSLADGSVEITLG